MNAVSLGGFGAASFWNLGGNVGSMPGANFVGTTDNQPLELKTNGTRALRLEPNTNGAPNVIGGSSNNFAGAGVIGATINGGGAVNYLGFSLTNKVTADFGTVGGGYADNVGATHVINTGGGTSRVSADYGEVIQIGRASCRERV